MKKNDCKNIFILLGITLLGIIIIFLSGYIFGSNMDFINQHAVIPDYFRNYFYTNHKLVPEVFYNLGSGQNAYNFSYYGLLNPIILVSYLLPFISMRNYIMGSSIILSLLTIFLFYKWISNHFNSKYSFLLTLLFLFSAPLFFHFHRQIMFVNYIPFLLLAFINIDKDNKVWLVINIFLMIMTSYYFSVVGMLALIIYYIYINFNKSLKEKLKIIIPIIISILLAGLLLIPTLDSILSNRMEVNSSINLLNLINLIIPNFNYSSVLYGSYALGLFSISIISMIWFIIKNKKDTKFLGITLLVLITFPIFRYIFNGGLYIRSKVLIPLLPLFILVIGLFLQDLFNKKIDIKKLLCGIIISLVLSLVNFNLIYTIDLIFTTVLILIYYKFDNTKIIYIPLILLFSISFVYANLNENYITQEEYNNLSNTKEIINDDSFYRVSDIENSLYNVNYGNFYKTSVYSSTINNHYSNFYHNVLKINNNNYNNLIIRSTDNIIFNRLLGVKYIYSNKNLGYGYENIADDLYENKFVLSLGYASSNIYSETQFNNLEYPYNLKYLLNGIITNNSNGDTENIVEEINVPASLKNLINTEFVLTQNISFTLNLDENLSDKLLFIMIDGLESNSCTNGDIGITINGIENVLNCKTWLYNNDNTTFNYVINENNLESLNIIIKKGEYKISDIKFYTMDKKYLETKFDEMENINIVGDKITGNINITNDGYMTISLPYDKNYHIYIDGKEADYEKTNMSFIGFKISEGNHNIEIIYKNKTIIFGKIFSISGLLLFVIYLLIIKKKYDKVI